MSKFVPREWPDTIECTTPHLQCFAGAQLFVQLLEHRTALVFERASQWGSDESALMRASETDALERQALSEGVQVFCAMTVESAINLLGVLILSEKSFMDGLERHPARKKLRTLARLLLGDERLIDEEVLSAVDRLYSARNGFVHPKPQEGTYRTSNNERRGDVASARAAMHDVQIVFAGIRGLHVRCVPLFALF